MEELKTNTKNPSLYWSPTSCCDHVDSTQQYVLLPWTLSVGFKSCVPVFVATPTASTKYGGDYTFTGQSARYNGKNCGRKRTISKDRRTIWTYTGTGTTTHHLLVISTERTGYLYVQLIVKVSFVLLLVSFCVFLFRFKHFIFLSSLNFVLWTKSRVAFVWIDFGIYI